MTNLTSKLWMTEKLCCYNFNKENYISSVFPKIYRCDVFHLILENQTFTFNEHIFISLAAKRIIYRDIVVKTADGSIVPFEKLVEAVPKVKKITFKHENSRSNINSKTFTELLKIPHFSKLQRLNLENIPEVFDFDAFYGYMKKNKFIKFDLEFSASISDAYKNRVETIIDEILQTEKHTYRVPLINFHGLSEEKFYKLMRFV
uniref:DUF38 domain-containing protein n=1 Tax=Panagrolaimus sp. ES5 TaxID=591445 RepID=A0AC34F7W8_9BILA